MRLLTDSQIQSLKTLPGWDVFVSSGLITYTQERFLEAAHKKHGDKYDYSKSKFTGYREEVTITCRVHGEFQQIVSNHLSGAGCQTCGGSKLLTTEDFITKAISVHGCRFDYSDTVYANSKTKVSIRCAMHGPFQQNPSKHLGGKTASPHGCPKCSHEVTSTEDFLRKAKRVHGDLFDYSKVVYISTQAPVIIICREHGEFLHTPNAHLSGLRGCPKCVGRKRTNKEFITLAKSVHGDKFNYSKVDYKLVSTPIIIICPVHGEFTQIANQHIWARQGCPYCAGHRQTTDTFVAKAKVVHGGKYDYSKSIYVGSEKKLTIICKVHGEFQQSPYHHVNRKQDCPHCAGIKLQRKKPRKGVRPPTEKKLQLLEMAERHEQRPNSRSSLGCNLNSYLSPAHGCYDANFRDRIRQVAPQWFKS